MEDDLKIKDDIKNEHNIEKCRAAEGGAECVQAVGSSLFFNS